MSGNRKFYLETERLRLSPWAELDRESVIALYANLLASRDFGRILRRDEIGWRLLPEFWGEGYATEAARAAQIDAQTRCGLRGIITYTSPDNLASAAVMKRLGYVRAPERDFSAHYSTVVGEWHGRVWDVPDPR